MAQISEFEKYAIRKPIYTSSPNFKSGRSPALTFMSNRQVPEAKCYIEMNWIYGIPETDPDTSEHVHAYDEIMLFWGNDPQNPQVLGGEIEMLLGGQRVRFHTTAGIFIPAGTPHEGLTWKTFESPHVLMSILLGTGDNKKRLWQENLDELLKTLHKKNNNFDYEQYVIRSPIRESGPNFSSGRQSPTMTYMSKSLISIASCYVEFGWIWGVFDPIPAMVHKKFDEVSLHIGSDPENPQDLGGEIQFGMGDDILTFNTSSSVYVPRSTTHGPVICAEVDRPFIEMSIMPGCGTLREGWGDSFLTSH